MLLGFESLCKPPGSADLTDLDRRGLMDCVLAVDVHTQQVSSAIRRRVWVPSARQTTHSKHTRIKLHLQSAVALCWWVFSVCN